MAHAMPARRGADVMQSVSVQTGAEPFAADGGPVGVLVCHGFTGSPRTVRPWAEHLAAAGLTVRAPRLPGHGTTGARDSSASRATPVRPLYSRPSGDRVPSG